MNRLALLTIGMSMTACGGAANRQTTESISKSSPDERGDATYSVVLASDASWEQLNPARGDKSPGAATLWGNRSGSEPTGFLFRAIDGFKSPPHIHNVSYRGVVIRGLVHNDDPNAEEMWMPSGAFWTQPKGAVHITSAKGSDVLAYIEIDEGPYLVRAIDQAFESDERPINVDPSNVVWLVPPGMSSEGEGPRLAFLWGDPATDEPSGAFLKLPAGFSGTMRGHGATLRAVVIQGQTMHRTRSRAEFKTLEAGSYFSSAGMSRHQLSCAMGVECLLYVRSEGTFDIVAPQPVQ